MLQLKDCINFLNNRPEFLGLQEEQIKYRTLSCARSGGVFNQDWINFNTTKAILKVSDGLPRFCYFGSLYIGLDGGQVSFSYRGSQVYATTSIENHLAGKNNLFDSTFESGASIINWQFVGFIIDRGV